MDVLEFEEQLFAISDAKLHGEMCRILSGVYYRVLNIFPSIEATRPRSRSGIQTLCSLHVALEKAKNLLQHCSECSKMYLAITGDAIVLKFEKTKCALQDSLRRVEDIVPRSIACQVEDILNELEGIVFSLDPSEKQVGDDMIALLQQSRSFDDTSADNDELASFHQAASKLGITSSRAALVERRALKKLIEKARAEADKRKESIVAYLFHLMNKHSKLFRTELGDDPDSQGGGSGPCSPTVQSSSDDNASTLRVFERQMSKIGSFNFRPSYSFRSNGRRGEQHPVPPEELRCPISLQLMFDPVIVSSGQTYERVCIEKWFGDGHGTCPKTRQRLAHLGLTPNYCVKGLIATWCEQNGVAVPDGPPESLDLNYWRLALSDTTEQAKKPDQPAADGAKAECGTIAEDDDGDEAGSVKGRNDAIDYGNLMRVLRGNGGLSEKARAVECIRGLVKDDSGARVHMGARGFVEELVGFVRCAVDEGSVSGIEVGSMALFNLAVNNTRNKESMLNSELIPLLEDMANYPNSHGPAAALYLNLTCLEQAKPTIGSSRAVPFLVKLLLTGTDPQSRLDALHALFNLSTCPSNIPRLLECGAHTALQAVLLEPPYTEKSIAVLLNMSSDTEARDPIISTPGLIPALAAVLDAGELAEQEQCVSCLLMLCNDSEECSRMVLQEGVIPSLVSLQVNGTTRGRDRAQRLLSLFRQQRQEWDPLVGPTPAEPPDQLGQPVGGTGPVQKPVCRRRLSKSFSFFRRSKSISGPQ